MNWRPHDLAYLHAVAASFAGGVFLAQYAAPAGAWIYGALALAAAMGAASVFFARLRAAMLWLLLLFLALGCLRWQQASFVSSQDVSALIGRTAALTGTVAEAPRVFADAEGKRRVRYVLRMERAVLEGQARAVTGKAQVYAPLAKGEAPARWGDAATVSGAVRAVRDYRNPGRYDRAAALGRRGVRASVYAKAGGVRVEPREAAFLMREVLALRQALRERMGRAMSEADAAALFAMLFGGREGVKPELIEAFTMTGIVHLLAVSGAHMALLVGLVAGLGALLRLPRPALALLVALSAAGYAALALFAPSVVRAGVMATLAFAAQALGREGDARRALALAVWAMLLWDPALLWDVGFQLSIGATAGLLYIAPLLEGLFCRLPRWLGKTLSLTLAAQLGTLPLLLGYFHFVSLSAVPANLLAVPLAAAAIAAGFVAAALGLVAPFLQTACFALCAFFLGGAETVASLLARLPGGAVYLPFGGAAVGAAYYLLLYGAVYLAKERPGALRSALRRYGRRGAAAALALFVCVVLRSAQPGPLQVHFIDVGQGDAALCLTPHGRAIVIDAGGQAGSSFDIGAQVVAPYLRYCGVREIECLILSHAHEDHAGGAGALLRSFPVRRVLVGNEDRRLYAAALKIAPQAAAALIPAQTGQELEVDGVRLRFVHAPRQAAGNEASAVVRLTYGQTRFLFTGDLEGAGEDALLASGEALRAEVLKVAHHGARTSSSAAFLAAVAPRLAVISAGQDNRFGHPHEETLRRLAEAGGAVLRTDRCGAVVVESDGKSLAARTFAPRCRIFGGAGKI